MTKRSRPRRGLAALELVMTTAVAVPLAVLLFFLAVKMTAYVFRGLDGMVTMPWL